MDDDIVFQLREIQWNGPETWVDKMKQAADEIERLRELSFHDIYFGQLKLDEIEYLQIENNRWRTIANELYAALEQMKKRRGIDLVDAELVIGALENYEKAVAND